MKKIFKILFLIACLARFTSLAAAQTSQENVTVNRKSFVKIWSSDRTSYLLKPAGEVGISKNNPLQQTTPESHLHESSSKATYNANRAKLQKNGSEAASQVKPTPIMVIPRAQQNSVPKN